MLIKFYWHTAYACSFTHSPQLILPHDAKVVEWLLQALCVGCKAKYIYYPDLYGICLLSRDPKQCLPYRRCSIHGKLPTKYLNGSDWRGLWRCSLDSHEPGLSFRLCQTQVGSHLKACVSASENEGQLERYHAKSFIWQIWESKSTAALATDCHCPSWIQAPASTRSNSQSLLSHPLSPFPTRSLLYRAFCKYAQSIFHVKKKTQKPKKQTTWEIWTSVPGLIVLYQHRFPGLGNARCFRNMLSLGEAGGSGRKTLRTIFAISC